MFASEPGEYLARLCGDLGPGLHRGLGLKLNRKTKPRKPALQTPSSLIKFYARVIPANTDNSRMREFQSKNRQSQFAAFLRKTGRS